MTIIKDQRYCLGCNGYSDLWYTRKVNGYRVNNYCKHCIDEFVESDRKKNIAKRDPSYVFAYVNGTLDPDLWTT